MVAGEPEDSESMSVDWSDFDGEPNTERVVIHKARALAEVLFLTVSNEISAMQEELSSDGRVDATDERWWSVFYDSLLYMIHIADREAYAYLEETKRSVFIEQLLRDVADKCAADFDSDLTARQFRQSLLANITHFQSEFSEYERGQTEFVTENLVYMFAQRIQQRLDLEPDIVLTSQIVIHFTFLEIYSNIPTLLSAPEL